MEVSLARTIAPIRQAVAAVVWLVAVLAIAFGSAGIVAGLDTPAADGGDRTGRTVQGDAAVDRALTPIEDQLRAMADEIRTLTGHARGVLAGLSANDMTLAETAVATGTPIVNDIDTQAHTIREALVGVPLVASPGAAYGVSPAIRERYANDHDAIAATDGVTDDWTRLTVGSISASRLSGLLMTHDQAVVRAAERGRAADYGTALVRLATADAAIKDARALRDNLVASVDVSTLDSWLDRSAAYDKALRTLYTSLRASGGKVTDAVRKAARDEQTAKARLPPDTRALVLIMGEIGRGGMTDSAVAIEQAASDIDEVLSPPATETP